MDSSGDDFEDDPFNYQPLKRRKLAHNQTQNRAKVPATQKILPKGKATRPSETRKRIGPQAGPSVVGTEKRPAPKTVTLGPSETLAGPSQVTHTSKKSTQPRKATGRVPSPILSQKLSKVTKTLKDLLNSSEEISPKKQVITSKECPLCQLPLHLLVGVGSSSNHLAECGENSFR